MTVIVNDGQSNLESKKEPAQPAMLGQERKVLRKKSDSFGSVVKKDLAIA